MAAPVDSGYLQSNDPTKPRSDAAVPFRDIIPASTHPRIAGIAGHDALSWCESRRQIEAPAWLINRLEKKNLEQPYKGFTSDGKVREGLYEYADDEGAPTEEVIVKTEELMKILSEQQRKAVHCGEVTDDEFRLWSNPELYMNPGGLRLDECSPDIQTAIHAIIRASSSKQGYEKILGCCLTNDFLGHLVNGKKVLNEHSYNFRLFGTRSLTSPWGYTFFGHHLCINVVFLGKRMVIGPTFMGAEPDRIDEGPHAGLRLFRTEELESLKLMQGLPTELQEKATLSKEGCPVSEFPPDKQESIINLFLAFNEYYPEPVLQHRLALFKKYLPETYFAWIGEFGDEDPYYYRIHSPVGFMELDFHCGIFLTNTSPARCHIHTTNRLPNRGDYGRALIGA
ncbi:hypothetical protein EG329_013740 [Mollisiaceae sp. DMI_Dod_QoI]|nr:hypothetical protein EG329_013740 [Helotiales sp. DMI_Dod_QoI]